MNRFVIKHIIRLKIKVALFLLFKNYFRLILLDKGYAVINAAWSFFFFFRTDCHTYIEPRLNTATF